MFIKKLYLKNYRNYKTTEIEFKNCVNVIIGENAQGKTNIVESIYLLSMAKSHRTTRDKELIQWNAEFSKIIGSIEKRNSVVELELVISNKGKKVKVNGLEQRKLSEFIGNTNIVLFAPEDLNIVKGSPQVRRRFIDMEIGQINPMYIHHLGVYQKVLLQRNHLLKDLQQRRGDKMMLEVLTNQLVTSAAKILHKRLEFIIQLEEWAKTIHYQISREKEVLNIQYKPSIDVSEQMDLSKLEEEYYGKFKTIVEREIQRGTTLIGPHRDDVVFFINDIDVQTYGSQGQQRTTALSVKMAEIELIKEKVGEYPILLLDDVLSELDDYRQSHLLHAIQGKVQTFVTTTSVDGISHQTLNDAAMYVVTEGSIKKLR